MGVREIAKKTNVSIATVSRVLNNPELVKPKTRQKVLLAIKDLDYKKYQSAYFHEPKDEIAVILPNVHNVFFAIILEGIIKKAQNLDITVNLNLSNDDEIIEKDIISKLSAQKVKGVIMISARNKEHQSAINIKQLKNIPLVLVDRDIGDHQHSGIFLSNANAVYDAVNMLINQGRKKIAIITGPKNNINSKQRLEGYKKALIKSQINISENLIFHSDFTADDSFKITTKILQSPQIPEVIFCCSNRIAIGCIKAIKQKKLKLNKDITIFSFNKLEVAQSESLEVPYIEHPIKLLGERSVEILKNKLVGTQGVIREILNYQIIN